MEEGEFSEVVVEVKRVSKKTKGGNQMRFTALLVVGNKNGKVGAALAKAPDVRSAIRKASKKAREEMIEIPLKGRTLHYPVNVKFGAAKLLLKPAPVGSGVIAGGTVRVVLESLGVRDAVAKVLGTNNKTTNVYATIKALKKIKMLVER